MIMRAFLVFLLYLGTRDLAALVAKKKMECYEFMIKKDSG